jgi:hypothetical protein
MIQSVRFTHSILPSFENKRRSLVMGKVHRKEPKHMTDVSRKAQLTAELLRLTQLQSKALEDAVYLGWSPGEFKAYQERGERVSVLRPQLNTAVLEEGNLLPDTILRESEPDISGRN